MKEKGKEKNEEVQPTRKGGRKAEGRRPQITVVEKGPHPQGGSVLLLYITTDTCTTYYTDKLNITGIIKYYIYVSL